MCEAAEHRKIPCRYLSMAVVGVINITIELYICGYIRDEKPSMQGGNALQPYVPLAQMAEHMTFNHGVWSSNLQWYTKCSVGQEVKTLPFHGSNTSSSLVPSTNMLIWRNRQTQET